MWFPYLVLTLFLVVLFITTLGKTKPLHFTPRHRTWLKAWELEARAAMGQRAKAHRRPSYRMLCFKEEIDGLLVSWVMSAGPPLNPLELPIIDLRLSVKGELRIRGEIHQRVFHYNDWPQEPRAADITSEAGVGYWVKGEPCDRALAILQSKDVTVTSVSSDAVHAHVSWKTGDVEDQVAAARKFLELVVQGQGTQTL